MMSKRMNQIMMPRKLHFSFTLHNKWKQIVRFYFAHRREYWNIYLEHTMDTSLDYKSLFVGIFGALLSWRYSWIFTRKCGD